MVPGKEEGRGLGGREQPGNIPCLGLLPSVYKSDSEWIQGLNGSLGLPCRASFLLKWGE